MHITELEIFKFNIMNGSDAKGHTRNHFINGWLSRSDTFLREFRLY